LLLGFMLGAAAAGWTLYAYVEAHPKVVYGWHRAEEQLPPDDGSPFVGAWVRDGRLEVEFARRIDRRYFGYVQAPLGSAPFFGYVPPVWWVEAPGAALP
jgi:hypothetical protein